ncbi:MAG: branched-chain amino acid transaminase [Vampirovibrionales bacterium]
MMTTPPRSIVYFNGQFVPLEEATVNVRTHAFMYGTSIFEGIRAYYLPDTDQMAIFRLREHYQRFYANAKMCYMEPPISLEELEAVTVEVVKQNKHTQKDTYIRPMVYKGGVDVIGPNIDKAPTCLTVWTQPLGDYVSTSKALNVCISNWRRVDDNALPPRLKCGGSYMNAALIVTDAKRGGFDEAIVLTQDGHVGEGSAMNLMLVRNGKIITPPVSDNILEGITRATLIELAKKELGLPCEERTIDRTELYVADEVFFCGTGAQVAAVGAIDHRLIGSGEMGPITTQLQSLYFDVVRNQVPAYSSWLTLC